MPPPSPPSTCSAQRDPEPDSNAAADGRNGVSWAGGELEDLYKRSGARLTEAWQRYTAAARVNPDTSAFPTAAPSSTRHVVAGGIEVVPRRRVATPGDASRDTSRASSQRSRPCPQPLVYETLAPGTRVQGLPVSETRVRNQRSHILACPRVSTDDQNLALWLDGVKQTPRCRPRVARRRLGVRGGSAPSSMRALGPERSSQAAASSRSARSQFAS